jgi:hypothetical protein
MMEQLFTARREKNRNGKERTEQWFTGISEEGYRL